MRLLITTQAVDLDDPVLSFFHPWIEEFSKRCETVHVICLKEGRHNLPKNVLVHSLGKEFGASRVQYIFRLYRYIWQLRKEYDAVFAHMNPEYVVLGGFLWRLWRKHVGLWYVHRSIPFSLRAAIPFVNVIFTATTDSMRIITPKKRVVGHGIDIEHFRYAAQSASHNSILFFGRLDPVKKPEVFIDALEELSKDGVVFKAAIYGNPTKGHEKYAHDVRNRAAALALNGQLSMYPGISNDKAPSVFAGYAIYCNLTQSGSFDKTIGEAAASGCVIVSSNEALRGVIPGNCIVDGNSAESVAAGLHAALSLSEDERIEMTKRTRAWVEREYSLILLIGRIIEVL